jgi:excisionase family DNA binding protein
VTSLDRRRDANVVPLRSAPSAQMLTVADVVRILRVSKMSVYRLVQGGELRGYRIGRSIRIRTDDLSAYLAAADTTRDHQA